MVQGARLATRTSIVRIRFYLRCLLDYAVVLIAVIYYRGRENWSNTDRRGPVIRHHQPHYWTISVESNYLSCPSVIKPTLSHSVFSGCLGRWMPLSTMKQHIISSTPFSFSLHCHRNSSSTCCTAYSLTNRCPIWLQGLFVINPLYSYYRWGGS